MNRLFFIIVMACLIITSCTTNENDNQDNGNNDVSIENVPDNEIIRFEDLAVKMLCITMWDTNNDNNLSVEEAKVVQSLGSVFYKNNQIRKFNELIYFTGLKEIDEEAFYMCRNLYEITFPSSITSIGAYAFYETYLKNITIPNSVEEIEEGAFAGSALESITLSNKLSVINEYSFASCRLENIEIPNSVTTINAYAFFNTGLLSVRISNNLQSIGEFAFYQNHDYTDRFREIQIPETVTLIGDCIFGMGNNDEELEYPPLTIYCESLIPPKFEAGSEILGVGIDKIVVPSQAVNNYKNAPIWKLYKEIITNK